MSFPFKYELTLKGLEIKLGPFVFKRIPYTDIEFVKEGWSMFTWNLTNFWPPRFVTVRRKTGWFKNILINPTDRPGFAAELRKRLGR
jgi:hypothetical protein